MRPLFTLSVTDCCRMLTNDGKSGAPDGARRPRSPPLSSAGGASADPKKEMEPWETSGRVWAKFRGARRVNSSRLC